MIESRRAGIGLCLVAMVAATAGCRHRLPEKTERPKVLFFAWPDRSDNEFVRRPAPDVPAPGERYFVQVAGERFDVVATQDPTEVARDKLSQYRVVIFFTAINPPIDKEGLVEWVKSGGAFVGIHCTANTFQSYAPFGEMLGAYYDVRPWLTKERIQANARIQVEDRAHPATQHLPASFDVLDDIYLFKKWDPTRAHVLLSLDRASLDWSKKGAGPADRPVPVSWAKSFGNGWVFYTALGDWEGTWKEEWYRRHLMGGIEWVLRQRESAGR